MIIGLTSVSQAGHRLPGPATLTPDVDDPSIWHATAGLGNARAQSGTASEAGCTIDPAPSGNVVTCWVQDASGDRRECVARDAHWTALVASLNSDSMIEFAVQVPPPGSTATAPSAGSAAYGDCLSFSIENSSAYQPKGQ